MFSFGFMLDNISCSIVQAGYNYELRVNNVPFKHIIELLRNKKLFAKAEPTVTNIKKGFNDAPPGKTNYGTEYMTGPKIETDFSPRYAKDNTANNFSPHYDFKIKTAEGNINRFPNNYNLKSPITPDNLRSGRNLINFDDYKPIDSKTLDNCIDRLVSYGPANPVEAPCLTNFNSNPVSSIHKSHQNDELNNLFGNNSNNININTNIPELSKQEVKAEKVKESMKQIYNQPQTFDSKKQFTSQEEMLEYFNRMNQNHENIVLGKINNKPDTASALGVSQLDVLKPSEINVKFESNNFNSINHNEFPKNFNSNNFNDFNAVGSDFEKFTEFKNNDPFFNQVNTYADNLFNNESNSNNVEVNTKINSANYNDTNNNVEKQQMINKIIYEEDSSCKSSSDSVCDSFKEIPPVILDKNTKRYNDSIRKCLDQFDISAKENIKNLDENKENIYPTFSELSIHTKYRDAMDSKENNKNNNNSNNFNVDNFNF